MQYKYEEVVNEGYPQYSLKDVAKESEYLSDISDCIAIRDRLRVLKVVIEFMDEYDSLNYRVEQSVLRKQLGNKMRNLPISDQRRLSDNEPS